MAIPRPYRDTPGNPSRWTPWEPPSREAGRDPGARGARGGAAAGAAARAPARGGFRVGRKWPFSAPLLIPLIYEMGHFAGVGSGPDFGCTKSAHFGGYLITLPVGTKLGPFFRAGFWDKIRGSGTEPRLGRKRGRFWPSTGTGY